MRAVILFIVLIAVFSSLLEAVPAPQFGYGGYGGYGGYPGGYGGYPGGYGGYPGGYFGGGYPSFGYSGSQAQASASSYAGGQFG
ncbi:protein suex-1 [Drosophila tropicalis]|uniref:protein suex-1 n=1 Tax=Drosophila tropicalis TaxID=46794 RepID=UPI0035ABC497